MYLAEMLLVTCIAKHSATLSAFSFCFYVNNAPRSATHMS